MSKREENLLRAHEFKFDSPFVHAEVLTSIGNYDPIIL